MSRLPANFRYRVYNGLLLFSVLVIMGTSILSLRTTGDLQESVTRAAQTQQVLRHWRDLLVHRRGTRLVNGNALIGGLALILLAVFTAAPAVLTRADARLKLAGGALSLCLAAWAVTPLFGAFPVPLVGVGMSPILGAWLGVGLLAAATRARTP